MVGCPMKQLYQNLWQTRVEHPFSGLNTHAYFLQQDAGNVLFYNTSNTDELDEMAELGGVTCQYLSHRHESGPSLSIIKTKFHSKLCSSALEAPFIDGKVDEKISIQQGHRPNIMVIPTPGHTYIRQFVFLLCRPFRLKLPVHRRHLFSVQRTMEYPGFF